MDEAWDCDIIKREWHFESVGRLTKCLRVGDESGEQREEEEGFCILGTETSER